jgi:hypothetical protein
VAAVVGKNRKQEHGDVQDELEHVGEEQRLKRGAVGEPLVAARCVTRERCSGGDK